MPWLPSTCPACRRRSARPASPGSGPSRGCLVRPRPASEDAQPQVPLVQLLRAVRFVPSPSNPTDDIGPPRTRPTVAPARCGTWPPKWRGATATHVKARDQRKRAQPTPKIDRTRAAAAAPKPTRRSRSTPVSRFEALGDRASSEAVATAVSFNPAVRSFACSTTT